MDEALYGSRNARGEWTPNKRAGYGPLFAWPTKPLQILKWLPSYLLPWNALYASVAVLAYLFATPAISTMRSFSPGWIALILLRNLLVVVAWYSLFHWRLYLRRSQDTRFKYNARWPRTSERFTFGSQNRENVFWALASGVPIWTAWEALSLWLFANGHIPWLQWSQHPVWFVVIFLLVPMWRDIHFYWVHRLIHVPWIYRRVHALHHRNTNPGPWSGLSMHPVEHLLYFSAVAIHWVVPSHPVHAMFNLFHAGMAPVPGHTGFEKIELGEAHSVDTNCWAHYLHHKYFEVNYADGAIPFDRWFGSFHDGSPAAHAAMKTRLATRNVPTAID